MTKEQYFHLRQHAPGDVLYSYYKEKFDHSKHKPFIKPHEFMQYLTMWGDPKSCFDIACQYYEAQLGITKVINEKGQIISVL